MTAQLISGQESHCPNCIYIYIWNTRKIVVWCLISANQKTGIHHTMSAIVHLHTKLILVSYHSHAIHAWQQTLKLKTVPLWWSNLQFPLDFVITIFHSIYNMASNDLTVLQRHQWISTKLSSYIWHNNWRFSVSSGQREIRGNFNLSSWS